MTFYKQILGQNFQTTLIILLILPFLVFNFLMIVFFNYSVYLREKELENNIFIMSSMPSAITTIKIVEISYYACIYSTRAYKAFTMPGNYLSRVLPFWLMAETKGYSG